MQYNAMHLTGGWKIRAFTSIFQNENYIHGGSTFSLCAQKNLMVARDLKMMISFSVIESQLTCN